MPEAAGTDSTPDTHPDAALIAACREHVEARDTLEGPRIWDDPAGAWAGDAVLSLLRLHGETVA